MRVIRNAVLILAIACSIQTSWASPISRHPNPIKGTYIVRLRQAETDVDGKAHALANLHGGTLRRTFKAGIKGFVIEMPDQQAQRLADDPDVEIVEEDTPLILSAVQTEIMGQAWIFTPPYPAAEVTIYPDWWLDRSDQPDSTQPRMNGSYTFDWDGNGVDVYVMDRGIAWDQPEFARIQGMPPNGNAAASKVDPGDALHNELFPNFVRANNASVNCATGQHGTAVASLIAGWKHGVAKGAHLIDAQIFSSDCSGGVEGSSESNAIAAMDWIATHKISPLTPAIVNISWVISDPNQMSGLSAEVDSLSRNYNMTFVTAAGNQGQDVAGYAPGNSSKAITVGGLAYSGGIWPGSNWGNRIDFYAPAQLINAASKSSDRVFVSDCFINFPTADGCLSGTSFSAPIAAGVAAQVLQYLQLHPELGGTDREHIMSSGTDTRYQGMVQFAKRIYPVNSVNGKYILQAYLAERRHS